MSMTAIERRLTVADLEAMPDEEDYELIDGRLVAKPPMGNASDLIATRLTYLLSGHCEANPLGWVFGETGYQCFPDNPFLLRKPDASFVRFGRYPGEQIPEGYTKFAPDFVAEVISPNDLAEDVEIKIEQFLAAGVRMIWVIYPKTRTAYVYRGDLSVARFRADDELSGEDVVPGFRCRVGDLFPAPPALPAGD
jgi:Uma2 family endonuclease